MPDSPEQQDWTLPLNVQLAIIKTKLTAIQKSIDSSETEHTRRLNELNHMFLERLEHDREYVLRETFDRWQIEFDKWRKEIDRWRWLSVGFGLAGGGLGAALYKLLTN